MAAHTRRADAGGSSRASLEFQTQSNNDGGVIVREVSSDLKVNSSQGRDIVRRR
jgi:hypothetical protein